MDRTKRHPFSIGVAVAAALIATAFLWRATPDAPLAPDAGDKPLATPVAVEKAPDPPDPAVLAALPVSPNAKRTRAQWYEDTHRSTDIAKAVRDAAAAAEAGDDGAARAMTYIMLRCALPLRSIRSGGTREAYIAGYGKSNSAYAAHLQRIYDQCAPLATAAGFEGWENVPGGKWGVKYWRDLSLELGNPATEAEVLAEDLMQAAASGTPEQRTKAQQKAHTFLKDILQKADGESWYVLGMRLGNSDLSSDISTGFALALAACEIGYDCSGDNERNDWYACRWLAGCTETIDLNEHIRAMTGPELYAKSYARSQQLVEMIQRGAWNEVEDFVKLDGSLFER